MGYREETKKLIFSLLHDSSPHYDDVLRLVHITSALAKSYLKNYYPSFLRLCTQEGLNEWDLAEDSILQIFARDETGSYYILKNFADSLDLSFKETNEEEKIDNLSFADELREGQTENSDKSMTIVGIIVGLIIVGLISGIIFKLKKN